MYLITLALLRMGTNLLSVIAKMEQYMYYRDNEHAFFIELTLYGLFNIVCGYVNTFGISQ
jgi:hypothetical protein